jgi:hypothetical protein
MLSKGSIASVTSASSIEAASARFWPFAVVRTYVMATNRLDLGDPGPVHVTLYNNTDTKVAVWYNWDTPYPQLSPEATIDPGGEQTVSWITWDDPSFRVEDSSGQTIYCGLARRSVQTAFSNDRPTKARVEIVKEVNAKLENLSGITVCQPPI